MHHLSVPKPTLQASPTTTYANSVQYAYMPRKSIGTAAHKTRSYSEHPPLPATSPMPRHNRPELLSPISPSPSRRTCAYPLTIVGNIATIAVPLLFTSLTYIYKYLVLFSLPPIYQGYLRNHYHRTLAPGCRFEYDSKAWNRAVYWTASVCYAAVVCTLCCLQTSLSVAYNSSSRNTAAIVFGYITTAVNVGGLLNTIIISVFVRLAEAQDHKVYLLPGNLGDQEREWRVEHIAVVFSVPPSSLIWSINFTTAAAIFFPDEVQMHTICLSPHPSHRTKELPATHLADLSSAGPSTAGTQPSSLPPAALLIIVTMAVLAILHLLFVLRTITRLTNTQSDSAYNEDNTDSSQEVHSNSGTCRSGQAQTSCGECASSGYDASETGCEHGSDASQESVIDIDL